MMLQCQHQLLVYEFVLYRSMRVNYLHLCSTPAAPNTPSAHRLMLMYPHLEQQSGKSRASESSRSDTTSQHLCKRRRDSRRLTLLSVLLISRTDKVQWKPSVRAYLFNYYRSGSFLKWLHKNLGLASVEIFPTLKTHLGIFIEIQSAIISERI